MKIIDIHTAEIYYDVGSDEEEISVTKGFWEALKNKKIQYRTGKKTSKAFETIIVILDLKDKEFGTIFKRIADSEIGKEVMAGRLPVDTIL